MVIHVHVVKWKTLFNHICLYQYHNYTTFYGELHHWCIGYGVHLNCIRSWDQVWLNQTKDYQIEMCCLPTN